LSSLIILWLEQNGMMATKLFDGIAQALENEATVDLVFGALIYKYQICNNRQEGNMGDSSWVIAQM
jgi:hypothetical protein